MLDHWNDRCSPQWSPEELSAKVKNAYRYAKERPGVATAQADFGAPERSAPEPRRLMALRPFPTGEPNLDQTYLVKEWLQPGQMSVLVGQSNVGKTFVALDLLLAIARGKMWFGKRTERRAVAYLAAEGTTGIAMRLHAYKRHHKLADQDVEKLPFGYLAAPVNLRDSIAEQEDLIEILKGFEEQAGMPLGLVVVDTLARAMAGGNENSAEDMGAYIRTSDAIRTATGAHIMHIHHLGKDTSKGGRGSSALRAATDTEILVTKTNQGASRIKVTKQRDLMGGASAEFQLTPVTLGTDQDGDPVTSCVATEWREVVKNFVKSELAEDSHAARALAALHGLLKDKGAVPPAELGLPEGVQVVGEKAWRQKFREGLSGSVDTTRKAFNRAKEELQKGNHIDLSRDFVWISP